MDYVEMIKDQELVLGFQELITDADTVVVKRAVKVFTCVYHHTLRLLSLGELEEEIVLRSWSSVNGVVDKLLAMVRQCNNEGILIHLLRFLEAAVTAHLSFDVTKCPSVFERGRDVIKSGLKALKDLVTTPYVGGSSFIYGVRALISIACLRPDLWEPVTDLLKKQMASLPPTLFDHNVRSLNKALQKNLFRLLRRAEKYDLKEKLIEMMVSVGVPRKAIAPWAPQALNMRKRSPPALPSDLLVIGRQTPPEKKPRLDLGNNKERESKSRSRSNTPEIPLDPRLQAPQKEDPPDIQEILEAQKKENNADLMFLTSLLPKVKNSEPLLNQNTENVSLQSSSEKDLYRLLNLENVCSLVIQNMKDFPDKEPENFISSYKTYGMPSQDTNIMRVRLSSMLDKYIEPARINNSNKESQIIKSEFSSSSSLSSEPSSKIEEKINISSNSSSSTPASTPPLADTDMRQVFPPPSTTSRDVDMRISDPRLSNRDPRLAKDPRTRRDTDNRTSFLLSADPRLDKNNLESLPRGNPRTFENSIPLITDPRTEHISRTDPRTLENPMVKQRIDPRTSESRVDQQIDLKIAENSRVEHLLRTDPRNLDISRIDQPRTDPRNLDISRIDQPRTDPRNLDISRIDQPRTDPRNLDISRIDQPRTDPRNLDISGIDQPRMNPRTTEDSRMDYTQRTDPRTVENLRMDHMPRPDPRSVDPRGANMLREDPRLSNAKRPLETRKTRWDPRPDDSSSSCNGDDEFPSQRTVDSRMNRNPAHGQGLLPHPDPRIFHRENMDPRFSFQKPMNHGDLQPQQNFMQPQAPFTFNPANAMGQFNNPFLGNIVMPPPNALNSMFNNLPFGWDNNLRNQNPTVILAQTLASVQQGLLSPSIMNR